METLGDFASSNGGARGGSPERQLETYTEMNQRGKRFDSLRAKGFKENRPPARLLEKDRR